MPILLRGVIPTFLPPSLPLPLRPSPRLCTTATLGTLYIVSTPIGHTLDLTPRAASILQSADVIAAEDTRKTRQLLTLTQTPTNSHLVSCHEHNWRSRLPTLLDTLSAGKSVALVSDAGTPCISDPGYQVVTAAIKHGVNVVPIPGACAVLAALVASGLPMDAFSFVGFLARAGKERQRMLEEVGGIRHTVVMYEAPHRLKMTLRDLKAVVGGREVCLAREVTKKYEQFLRFGDVEEAMRYFEDVEPRGEFTVVIGPGGGEREDIRVDVEEMVKVLVENGVRPSVIARSLSGCMEVSKKMVYEQALRYVRDEEE